MSRRGDDELIAFEGVIEASSPKAILFKGDYWDKAEWVPRSQCTIHVDPEDETKATVTIKEWLVKKNGWSY